MSEPADPVVSPAEPPEGARWECHADDDVIDAVDEWTARAEFIQALVEDPGLIYVRAWREKGYEHDPC